jgi:N-acetylmuramoyl-L-alanine amidase
MKGMTRLAAALAAVAALAGPLAATPPVDAGTRPDAASLRPHIAWKPIPFGARRRAQMAAYSRRHYGRWGWRLTSPKVIVEHFTDGTTWEGAWNTFASNARHLGEKPGTCAHFLIDTDGTIYQLVNLGVRCRHVIGINDRSIGIEHVGTSAEAILANDRMMRASLRLTLWLRARFGIENRNVIGHAESLESPFHHERYPSWRCQTHADFNHVEMRGYRDHLRRLSRARDVPVGPPPAWVDPGC